MTTKQKRQQQAARAREALAAKRAAAKGKILIDLNPADAQYLLSTLNGDASAGRIKAQIVDRIFQLITSTSE